MDQSSNRHLSEEEQKQQVRRYDELHRHLLHDAKPVPPHLFLSVLQGDIPLRFPIACLLARHPSTPDNVLHYIARTSPDPECEYPYCSNSYEDRLTCTHKIPMDRKIFLYLNLLGRKNLTSHTIDEVSRFPEHIPAKMQAEILLRIVSRIETSAETLRHCSLHPNSDYAIFSLIMIHPNTAEEDRVIAALRQPHPVWWEEGQTKKLMEEFLTQNSLPFAGSVDSP